MHSESDYLKIQKEYRELQSRIAYLSSVEQQLINTKDSLDQELEQYKRLNRFNADILKAKNELDFTRITAEAIIDVFEIESSIVYIGDTDMHENGIYALEGVDKNENEIRQIYLELSKLIENNAQEQFFVREIKNNSGTVLSEFKTCIFFFNNEDNQVMFVGGFISHENAPLYAEFDRRKTTIFSVFTDQVKLQFSNRNKSNLIAAQLKKISQSEIELKKLSLIATKTKNGVIITNTKGEIEWVNHSFCEISGFNEDEVYGKKPKDFLHGKETNLKSNEEISIALREKKDIEIVVLNYHKDGTPYFNHLEITPVFNDEGEHINFIALQRDISKEINYQNEILRINSRFELITDRSNVGIWEWDVRNNLTAWNQILRNQYGIADDTPLEKLYGIFQDSIIEEDRSRVMAELENLIEEGGSNIVQSFRILNNSSKEVLTLRCFTLAERNENGELLRLIGSSFDITEQIQSQETILNKNEELRKINAELDNFVYSVSHDLRSPLLSIKGILTNVLKPGNLDEKTTKFLKLAEVSANRLDGTIQEILEYSRNARLNLNLEEVNLEELCNVIFDDLRYSVEDAFEFRFSTSIEMPIITDKARITALLKNVIGNASKYRKKDIANPFVAISIDATSDYYLIQVKDNGIGIPEKSVARIFEMFYRATTSSVGTGLGLYICQEIVNKLQGKISVTSQEGEGTTITIQLPIDTLIEETTDDAQ
jgi:PAS domain S-box-containing protein